jgi:hypothetical protein
MCGGGNLDLGRGRDLAIEENRSCGRKGFHRWGNSLLCNGRSIRLGGSDLLTYGLEAVAEGEPTGRQGNHCVGTIRTRRQKMIGEKL